MTGAAEATIFHLHPLRFTFIAREGIQFPPGKSANIVRGAFGTIFRRIACVPECHDVRSCPLRASCPYARMFEPSAIEDGPSGLADWPRPFVFRATHLDGCTLGPGTQFHFDLNLFDTKTPSIQHLVLTFAELARDGLGAQRSKVELIRVDQLNEQDELGVSVYDCASAKINQDVAPLELYLERRADTVSRLVVRFVTPTELKGGHELLDKPDFQVLAARIRDRISTLRQLYGSGPLEIDFRSFGERAKRVRMTRCEVQNVAVNRRSSRTGQVHSIGGFVGEAEYEGDLAEFLPYLQAARWTGVGRQTVWGKGELCTLIPQD